jgi:hypothetical protein
MKRVLFFLIIILLLGSIQTTTQAQSYKTGIGLRLGPSYGFSIKHFLSERLAIEGLVTSRYYGPHNGALTGAYGFGNGALGLNLTALVEYHFPIGNIDGLNWFIGGGLHLGIWAGGGNHPWFPNNRAHFLIGIDAIGGVEYTFEKIPLTLQVDIKPSLHFVEYFGVWYDEFAVTARYTF